MENSWTSSAPSASSAASPWPPGPPEQTRSTPTTAISCAREFGYKLYDYIPSHVLPDPTFVVSLNVPLPMNAPSHSSHGCRRSQFSNEPPGRRRQRGRVGRRLHLPRSWSSVHLSARPPPNQELTARSPLDLGGFPLASLLRIRAGLGEPEILRAKCPTRPNFKTVLSACTIRQLLCPDPFPTCSPCISPAAVENGLQATRPQQRRGVAPGRRPSGGCDVS